MIKKIILMVVIFTLIIAGCQKTEKQTAAKTEEAKKGAISESSVNTDISEIGSLDKDLSTEELENIESDLDEVNW